MPLPSKIAGGTLPVIVVGSGGWPVRQVDGNGVAIDDGVTIYSVAKPVVTVTINGATETGAYTYSVFRQVTISPTGHPVVRVDENGNVVTTALGSPISGGGPPALIFNIAANSQYFPLLAL